MKRPLRRLLRVRALVEEVARLQLEKRTAEMRALTLAAEHQQEIVRSARSLAIEDLTGGQTSGTESWCLRIADAALAHSREARLEALADAAKPGIVQAGEELLERRVERRQVEILHEAEMQAEEQRQIRQDQSRTDDWFQSRSVSRKLGR